MRKHRLLARSSRRLHQLAILLFLVLALSAVTKSSAQPVVVEAPGEDRIRFAMGDPAAPPAAIDVAAQKGVTPNLLRHRLGSAATAEPTIEPEQAERIVRQAYERVERALRAAGHDLTLEVGDVRTIPEREFPRHRYLDLFSMPEDQQLAVVSRIYLAGDTSWATFEIEWRAAESVPAQVLEEGRRFNVVEGLQYVSDHDVRFARHHIEAVATFEVRLAFEDVERRYRGAFFWFHDEEERLAFSPQDNVIGNIRAPLLETLKIVPVADFVPRPEVLPLSVEDLRHQSVDDPQHTTRCVDGAAKDHHRETISSSGVIEHETGAHAGAMRLAATCDTDTECRSSCRPFFAHKACTEIGERATLKGHMRYEKDVLDGDQQLNAASHCGGAYGCAIESCVFGSCAGISFEVSGSGAGISVSATGNYIFDRHGNLFRWAAHVLYDTGNPLSAVDVILSSGR